jgi:hypothetical protein
MLRDWKIKTDGHEMITIERAAKDDQEIGAFVEQCGQTIFEMKI